MREEGRQYLQQHEELMELICSSISAGGMEWGSMLLVFVGGLLGQFDAGAAGFAHGSPVLLAAVHAGAANSTPDVYDAYWRVVLQRLTI